MEASRTYPVVMERTWGWTASVRQPLSGRPPLVLADSGLREIVDGPAGSAHILTTERYDCVFSCWPAGRRRSA